MRSVGSLALGLALAAGGCRDQLPREGLRTGLLGCYALAYSDSAQAAAWGAPRYVVLDSAHAGPRPGRHLRFAASAHVPRRGGWWVADSLSETVRLTTTDGFVAVQLALTGGPDSLHGPATVSTDVGRGQQAFGRVLARRLSCMKLPTVDTTIAPPAT